MRVNGGVKDKVATPTLFKEPAALEHLVGIQRPSPFRKEKGSLGCLKGVAVRLTIRALEAFGFYTAEDRLEETEA